MTKSSQIPLKALCGAASGRLGGTNFPERLCNDGGPRHIWGRQTVEHTFKYTTTTLLKLRRFGPACTERPPEKAELIA